jgi:hypothetical protein
MKFEISPTGSLITGDVLDVNKDKLESILQHYDPQLYLKWNGKKNGGWGLWELRRRPAQKSVVDRVIHGGQGYVMLEYKESEWEHHVWDLPILAYNLLDRLKAADQWVMSNYDADQQTRLSRHNQNMTLAEYAVKDKATDKAREDMMYALRQDKQILKGFQEQILSGVNPAHLMRYWK